VCGFSDAAAGAPKAFRWTAAGGLVSLGVLPQGSASQAYGIAGGAGTVTGSANGVGGPRAFRWTPSGGMQNLGALPTGVESGARAVSSAGSAVVGYSDTFFGLRAIIWTPTAGMKDVRELLTGYGVDTTGWTLLNAYGVSSSGLVMAGTGSSAAGQRGWIAKLPVLPCYANCDGSTIQPVLNVNDMLCFVDQFMKGNTAANRDGSTSAPVLSIGDFLCYQVKYTQGCP
jgi:hypothetical protein